MTSTHQALVVIAKIYLLLSVLFAVVDTVRCADSGYLRNAGTRRIAAERRLLEQRLRHSPGIERLLTGAVVEISALSARWVPAFWYRIAPTAFGAVIVTAGTLPTEHREHSAAAPMWRYPLEAGAVFAGLGAVAIGAAIYRDFRNPRLALVARARNVLRSLESVASSDTAANRLAAARVVSALAVSVPRFTFRTHGGGASTRLRLASIAIGREHSSSLDAAAVALCEGGCNIESRTLAAKAVLAVMNLAAAAALSGTGHPRPNVDAKLLALHLQHERRLRVGAAAVLAAFMVIAAATVGLVAKLISSQPSPIVTVLGVLGSFTGLVLLIWRKRGDFDLASSTFSETFDDMANRVVEIEHEIPPAT
jgi:hypothetical protein